MTHAPEKPATKTAEYRLRPVYGLRLLGFGCIALAVVVGLLVALGAIDVLRSPIVTAVGWLLLAAGAAIIGLGAWLLLDRRPRLRLDQAGVLNRTGRSVGVREVAWSEIASIGRAEERSGGVLDVRLADDRTSRINLAVLDARPHAVEEQIRTRANHAAGYRPL